MKALMFAAVAALAANSYGIALTNCHNKVNLDCPQVVFKLTASGKTTQGVENGDHLYKTVKSLKVSKGALVLFGSGAGDDCCYDTYSVYAQAKVGKVTKKLAFLAYELKKWSVFGKNLENAMLAEKSKSYSLESDMLLFFDSEDSSTDLDSFDELTGVSLIASAFGKAKYKFSHKETNKDCGVCTVVEGAELTPGNYSGWFAGVCDIQDDNEECMTCACSDYDIFGGTWKARYNKAWSGLRAGWKSAASYVFGASVAADMAADEVE